MVVFLPLQPVQELEGMFYFGAKTLWIDNGRGTWPVNKPCYQRFSSRNGAKGDIKTEAVLMAVGGLKSNAEVGNFGR